MREPEPVALAWSGGKDSMLALHALRAVGARVGALITTVTREYDRVSVHGVRRALLDAQAAAVGVPLELAFIPAACTNDAYEASFGEALERVRSRGITTIAAGDLALRDVREYREALVHRHGMRSMFPLWQRDTARLARDFIELGYRAVLVCVDTHALDASFAGRQFDEAVLARLPEGVDPCGEGGEFHTFVYGGPSFAAPVGVSIGEPVIRDSRFAYVDLLPA